MRSFMRHGKVRRAAALSAAAGVLALAGPALPAAAQTAASAPWAPPPVDPSATAAHSGSLSPSDNAPPNDFQQKQGCLQPSTGGSVQGQPWAQQVLGIDQLHAQGVNGQGEKIAVIDTGINKNILLPPVDGSGGSSVPGGPATFDCDGHGTIVAGLIAAQRDPASGFEGIASGSSLMSIRQSSSLWQSQAQQGKTVGDTSTMAQAINYAVNSGAKVINISQASCQTIAQAQNSPSNQALQTAVFNAYQRGVVVVAAAGNVGEGGCQQNTPGSPNTAVLPAWYSNYVLSVASVNQQGAPSQFSIAGPWVGVAAPGEHITSVDPAPNGNGLASQIAQGQSGQMGPIQGTSFAAPYVAGLAALIKQKYPSLSAGEVISRIEQTAQHPGGTNGRNDIVGYGLINPDAALNDVLPSEYGKQTPPINRSPMPANEIPHTNWPALLIALGGAGIGIAAVIFTAFVVNAVRYFRARQADTGGRQT
jgi:membrane-anchored mycosin MYCP